MRKAGCTISDEVGVSVSGSETIWFPEWQLEDFDLNVGAHLLAKYRVPPELVVGCDETNVQLASCAKWTRSKNVVKRLRIIGGGSEK